MIRCYMNATWYRNKEVWSFGTMKRLSNDGCDEKQGDRNLRENKN